MWESILCTVATQRQLYPMKKKSSSQSALFNLNVLIGLFVVLAGVFLALLALGTFSNAVAQTNATQAQAQEPKAQQPGQIIVIRRLARRRVAAAAGAATGMAAARKIR